MVEGEKPTDLASSPLTSTSALICLLSSVHK
ncbi:RGD1564496 (predicted) [Rattus norvegicus]|uniref:RGD1564496 (Predicted) n=1 Tax=Rattus norvegicus TaxID=10116 RepID=A6J607_RAT|nr:RGD1564496 (predicted) [Rattus norvegicus]